MSNRRLLVLGAVFRECAISDPLRSMLFQSLFYEEALRSGGPMEVFLGYAWDTYNQAMRGGAQATRALAARLTHLDDLAHQLATPYAMATTAFVHAVVSCYRSEYQKCARYSEVALAIFRESCQGVAWEETFCAAAYFVALENVGPFSVLQREVTMMMRRAEARADALSLGLLATPLGAALLAEDKPEAAVRFLDGQLARSPDDLDLRTWGLIVRRIDAFLYQDAGLQAYRAVEDMWPRFESSDYARTPFVEMFTRMRRAHAALAAFRERPDTALQGIAVADARRLERMQRQDATIVAHGIRAAIAVQKGRHSEAAERLRAADSLRKRRGSILQQPAIACSSVE